MADSPSLPVSDTDYLNYFGRLADHTERYLFFASINLLLLYLRFLKYARISKSLTFLQDTMAEAMTDIFYFLLMLTALLLGFVFMAYLSFGSSVNNYHTLSAAFMTCFAMMVGEFDY